VARIEQEAREKTAAEKGTRKETRKERKNSRTYAIGGGAQEGRIVGE